MSRAGMRATMAHAGFDREETHTMKRLSAVHVRGIVEISEDKVPSETRPDACVRVRKGE
jgi:hypothetical protein